MMDTVERAAFDRCEARRGELQMQVNKLTQALWWACTQGTGKEPFSVPGWHDFIGAYEDAGQLLYEVAK